MAARLNFKSLSIHPNKPDGVRACLKLKQGHGVDEGEIFEAEGIGIDAARATMGAFQQIGKYALLPDIVELQTRSESPNFIRGVVKWRKGNEEPKDSVGPEVVIEALQVSFAQAVVACVFTCDQ